MRRMLALVAVMAIAAAACNGTTTNTTSGGLSSFTSGFNPRNLTFSARLVPFGACDAVLAHFKAEALERVGPYGLDGGSFWYGGPPFLEGDVAEGGMRDEFVTTAPATTTAGVTPGNDSATGGDGFSGTNNQVAGVDEPDIVKTDGNRIVSIIEGVMRLVDVTGDEPDLRDELRLESGWGHRFFISGDRAFVFSQGDIWAIPMFAADAARIAPNGWGAPVSIVQEVDLSNPDALRVVRTVRLDGTYLSARAIGDTVRMVVSSYPASLPFVYPSNPGAEDFALEANRGIIEASTIETWLPGYTTYDADGRETADGLLVDCAGMHRPEEFAGFDTLSVTTLDLGASLEVGGGTGIIAQGQTVYASQESLYVSTNVYIPNARGSVSRTTWWPSRKPTSRPFTSSISPARVLPSIGRAVRSRAISSTSSPWTSSRASFGSPPRWARPGAVTTQNPRSSSSVSATVSSPRWGQSATWARASASTRCGSSERPAMS